MPINFAAIAPHPPILIPQIGKENLSRLIATQKSFAKIREKIAENKISTLIIISPHGLVQNGAFTINLNPQFICSFEDFGDFATKKTFLGDIGLAHKIREALETKASLQLTSVAQLDHGSSVPLYLATQNLDGIKIIPLYYSSLGLEDHFKFGQLLQRELQISKSSIGIISSGDLSHRLTPNAPAGYSPQGKKFDKKLINLLQKNKIKEILNLDESLISEAGECGLRSIIILLGILNGIKYDPRLLSYEFPFGIGYLAMDFNF